MQGSSTCSETACTLIEVLHRLAKPSEAAAMKHRELRPAPPADRVRSVCLAWGPSSLCAGRERGPGGRRPRAAGDGAVPRRAGARTAAGDGARSRLRLPRRARDARRLDQDVPGPNGERPARRCGLAAAGIVRGPARPRRGGRGGAAPGRAGAQGRRPARLLPGPGPGPGRPARRGRRGVRAGPERAARRGTTCSRSSRRWAGSTSAPTATTRRWPSGRGWRRSSPTTRGCRSRSPRPWPRSRSSSPRCVRYEALAEDEPRPLSPGPVPPRGGRPQGPPRPPGRGTARLRRAARRASIPRAGSPARCGAGSRTSSSATTTRPAWPPTTSAGSRRRPTTSRRWPGWAGRSPAQGRAAEARTWLDRAVKLAPSRKELRLALIDQLVHERKFAEAAAQYEAISQADPNNPDVVRDWGRLLLRDTVAARSRAEAGRRGRLEPAARGAAARPGNRGPGGRPVPPGGVQRRGDRPLREGGRAGARLAAVSRVPGRVLSHAEAARRRAGRVAGDRRRAEPRTPGT